MASIQPDDASEKAKTCGRSCLCIVLIDSILCVVIIAVAVAVPIALLSQRRRQRRHSARPHT